MRWATNRLAVVFYLRYFTGSFRIFRFATPSWPICISGSALIVSAPIIFGSGAALAADYNLRNITTQQRDSSPATSGSGDAAANKSNLFPTNHVAGAYYQTVRNDGTLGASMTTILPRDGSRYQDNGQLARDKQPRLGEADAN